MIACDYYLLYVGICSIGKLRLYAILVQLNKTSKGNKFIPNEKHDNETGMKEPTLMPNGGGKDVTISLVITNH